MLYPYSHEKQLKLRDDTTDHTQLPNAPFKKTVRKAIYCKKLKGNHKFALTKVFNWPWGNKDWGFKVFTCEACGKTKHTDLK